MTDLLELRDERQPPRGQRPSRVGRWLAVAFVLLLLIGLIAGGTVAVRKFMGSAPEDYAGEGTGEVVVQIEPGDTAGDIADELVAKDVVKSRRAFFEVASKDPRALRLQPGFYRVSAQMSAVAAMDRLADPGSRLVGQVTVPEGLTVAQTLQTLAEKTEIPLEQYQAAAAAPAALGLPAYAQNRLEGFLFPATYEVEPGSTAVEVLTLMVERFEQAAETTGLVAGAEKLGLTPYEVVIVASLIEREVKFDDEYGQVARVVYNRLDQDIPLGIDAAILFGVGKTAGGELTRSDLAKDTPYENRRKLGLPPTPIASPGEATIKGALAPVDGDILFYVLATKEGRTFFTNSNEAFLRQRDKSRAEGIF